MLGGYDSWWIREASWGHEMWSGMHKSLFSSAESKKPHWEFRMPDCLANPYLQLASILAAGMDTKCH
jgi:glutamine synthetase